MTIIFQIYHRHNKPLLVIPDPTLLMVCLSGLSWCRLAYWEERVRVGPLHLSTSNCLQIYSDPASTRLNLNCDSLSLPDLMSSNLRASQSTLRTRDKIGLGK